MKPKEVFLSNSSQDGDIASRLADLLNDHGVPTFFSPHNILGAQQWHDEIGDALARCDWFLLILSPAAVKSMWVKRELMYALRKDQYRERIVPLLYKKCKLEALSWTLEDLQIIDVSRDFDTACRDLLRIWGIGLKN